MNSVYKLIRLVGSAETNKIPCAFSERQDDVQVSYLRRSVPLGNEISLNKLNK